MAITNLIGYRWKPNSTVTITSAATYDIQGVVEGGGNTIKPTFETTNFELIRIYRLNEFSGEYEYFIALSLGGGYFTSAQSTDYWGIAYSSSSYPTTLDIDYQDRNATILFKSGTDTTNTELISWLEANGTLEKEPVLQLRPFLATIANAIRTKKGTTESINAQNFADEIESIESGSGGLVGYTGTVKWQPYHIGDYVSCIVQIVKPDLSVETIKYTAEEEATTTISSPVILIAYAFRAGLPLTSAVNGELYDNWMELMTSVSNGVFIPTANDFILTLRDDE